MNRRLAGLIASMLAVLATVGVPARVSAAGEPPNPPVIFLHYDYMAAPPWDPSVGNFAPDPGAIERVVQAFRRRGITLHIDPQHTEIPYHNWLFFGPMPSWCNGGQGGVCANFFDLKERYFRPRGRQPWHYVIFGQFGINSLGDRVGGIAEFGGYNFMVTLPIPHQQCFFGTSLDFCKERVSGLFMHELGHNLGLDHGGVDAENYKLNYVSVMNYQYQSGIPYMAPGDTYQFGTWWGSPPLEESLHIAGIRIDYSDAVLPTLDEFHLDERAGLGGPSNSLDVTVYWACAADLQHPCTGGYMRVAAGPFDWNNDGLIESDVAAETNYIDNIPNDLLLTVQRGYDDWSHVHAFLRTPQYVSGALRPATTVHEPLPR